MAVTYCLQFPRWGTSKVSLGQTKFAEVNTGTGGAGKRKGGIKPWETDNKLPARPGHVLINELEGWEKGK